MTTDEQLESQEGLGCHFSHWQKPDNIACQMSYIKVKIE